jgi:hypothetical protein
MAKCLECGNEFEALRATAKYCSEICKKRYQREHSGTGDSLAGQESVLSGTKVLSGTDVVVPVKVPEVSDDVGTPAKVLDLVKDLRLDLGRDLGCTAWTQDGIFIKPDITYTQIQNIARLVAAKHGRPAPVFRQQGA